MRQCGRKQTAEGVIWQEQWGSDFRVARKSWSGNLEGKALPGATGNYTASLEAKGIRPEKIRCYGFAFEDKKVLIGKQTDDKTSSQRKSYEV